MASINYAARQISVKIVYYGPGLSGKTTNLQVIHKKTPQEHKSDMVSLATETDRTLFFDFLPLDLGKIKQFDTKFQLYTVPGQVYYNATRKLVLRGVDGVVFVADSGADKIQENLESFQNLEDNLAEYGYQRDSVPIILQYNKRDLPNALPVDELNRHINKYNLPYGEGIAYKGVGVFDTLKQIGKIVIDHLNKKYSRGGGAKPGTPPPAPSAYQPPPVSAYQPPQQQYAPPPTPYQPPQQQYAPPPTPYQPPQQQYAPPPPPYQPPQQQYAPPTAQTAYQPPQPAMPAANFDPFQTAPIAHAQAAQNFESNAQTADPFYAATPQQYERPTLAQTAVPDPFLSAAPPQQPMPAFEMAPPQQPMPAFEMAPPQQPMPAFEMAPPQQPMPAFEMAPPQQPMPAFEMAPPQQPMPAFEMAPPQHNTIDYNDAFMTAPPPPGAPPTSQGGPQHSPFDFEPSLPPTPTGGAQNFNAPTGGGSGFNLENFSTPAASPAAAVDLSFDYQSFAAPAAMPAPVAEMTSDYRSFAAPAADGFGMPAAPAQRDDKSELDLEIEKYQKELEGKQYTMSSNSGWPPPQSAPPPAYPGPSEQARQQAPLHNAFSDFEAELEGRRPGNEFNYNEEYPSDSAMFFTTVDKNTAMLKRTGKPPVNPVKKAQGNTGILSKLLKK